MALLDNGHGHDAIERVGKRPKLKVKEKK